MSAEDIIQLITELPPYLCYIYPGYISLYLIYFFMGYTLKDTNAKFLKSIVVSYLYVLFIQKLIIPRISSNVLTISLEVDSIGFNILLFVMSIACPYLIYMVLFRNHTVDRLLRFLRIDTTIDANEFDMLHRIHPAGAWIRVYFKEKNVVYAGFLTGEEVELEKTRFLCLSQYRKYFISEGGNERKVNDYSDNKQEKVIIYLDQVSHIEAVDSDNNN